jgi:hypothetical protein
MVAVLRPSRHQSPSCLTTSRTRPIRRPSQLTSGTLPVLNLCTCLRRQPGSQRLQKSPGFRPPPRIPPAQHAPFPHRGGLYRRLLVTLAARLRHWLPVTLNGSTAPPPSRGRNRLTNTIVMYPVMMRSSFFNRFTNNPWTELGSGTGHNMSGISQNCENNTRVVNPKCFIESTRYCGRFGLLTSALADYFFDSNISYPSFF